MAPSATSLSGAEASILRDAARPTPAQLWLGAVMDTSGHADELRGFLRALEKHGHAPAVRELRWTDNVAGISQAETQQIERQKRRTPKQPLIAVHEYLPGAGQLAVQQGVNVTRVMFETDRVPEQWLAPMLDRDELWVPSEFNVETFARSGVPREKLKILGGTMDFESFTPGAEPWSLGAPAGSFTFLTNFDFSERKGWKPLLRAWAKAFDRSDDVCLVLKTGSFYTSNADVTARIETFIREEFGAGAYDRLAPIRYLTDRLPSSAMPRLYAAADAYVLPSRGEGWGRPFMEALAMGLPTIASRFSGNLAFMDEETSWLVDGELVPVPDDADLWTVSYKGHKWFDADADELAAAMREIASNPDAARAKAAPARAELIRRFGYEAIANRIGELSADALERYGDRRMQPVFAAVRGPAGSVDSLAVGNDAIARHLTERGHNVHIRAQDAPKIDSDAPGLSQSWPPVFDPVSDGPTVMILPWEFGPPPREWLDQVRRRVDRVWVPSEYVRRGYVEGGMPAGIVEVNASGADVERFTPEGPKYPLPRQAGTTFLFVGGTTWRKGADVLLNAWRQAFGPDDDVQLVVKDHNVDGVYRNQTAGGQFKELAASGKAAPIVYMDDDLPFDDLPSLYRAADVVVLPYRAEGFCLPAVEAMACGIPVIHNGEGPTGEFVGDVGGWPLPAKRIGIPAEARLPELSGPGYVHEVDAAVLAETLRAVAADPEGRRERGTRGVEQARAYTWKAFADRAVEKLETLAREDLPLARDLRRAEIEARSTFAVYAPDWSDETAWGPVVDAWLDTFDADDDVTLALYVDGDADAVGARVMARLAGRDEATLADLALVVPSSVSLVALAASADAVIADSGTDIAGRPELFRRAARILSAGGGDFQSFAHEARARVAGLDFVVANTYPSSPPMNGGAARMEAMWSSMPATIGATSVVLSSPADEAVVPFTRERPGVEVQVRWSPELLKATQVMTATTGVACDDVAAIDAIQRDDAYVEALRQALAREPRAVVLAHPYLIRQVEMVDPDIPIIYEAHNVEGRLKAGMYPDTPAGHHALERVRAVEQRACDRASLVICMCEEDRQGLHEDYGLPLERAVVLPSGVWTSHSEFVPWDVRRAADPVRCVFSGSGHKPNVDAALLIVAAAQRLPGVHFDLIGTVATGLEGAPLPTNVHVHGRVSDERKQELFRDATLALNPMLTGSGANQKVIDYSAAGLPVVTTAVGARGYEPELTGRWLEHEPTADALTAAIEGALERDWTADIEAARTLVREGYDWRSLAARYAELLTDRFGKEER